MNFEVRWYRKHTRAIHHYSSIGDNRPNEPYFVSVVGSFPMEIDSLSDGFSLEFLLRLNATSRKIQFDDDFNTAWCLFAVVLKSSLIPTDILNPKATSIKPLILATLWITKQNKTKTAKKNILKCFNSRISMRTNRIYS